MKITYSQAWNGFVVVLILFALIVSSLAIWLSPDFGPLFVGVWFLSFIIATKGLKRVEVLKSWVLQSKSTDGTSPDWDVISKFDNNRLERFFEKYKTATQQGEKPRKSSLIPIIIVDGIVLSFHITPLILIFSVLSSGWPPRLIDIINKRLIPPLWEISFAAMCFEAAYSGRTNVALFMSVWMLLSSMHLILRFFTPVMYGENPYKIWFPNIYKPKNISTELHKGFLVVVAFAVVHYVLSKQNLSAYNESLTVIDSLYFSVVTATTVGFGDILPRSNTAKIISAVEMLAGFVYSVLILSTILTVWQKNHLSQTVDDSPKLTTKKKLSTADETSESADDLLSPFDFI